MYYVLKSFLLSLSKSLDESFCFKYCYILTTQNKKIN